MRDRQSAPPASRVGLPWLTASARNTLTAGMPRCPSRTFAPVVDDAVLAEVKTLPSLELHMSGDGEEVLALEEFVDDPGRFQGKMYIHSFTDVDYADVEFEQMNEYYDDLAEVAEDNGFFLHGCIRFVG